MPFNGSGSYTAPGSDFPAVTGEVVSSTKYNNVINDIATALSTCIAKDGQSVISGNIPFATYKITGLGPGTTRTDAANIANLQDRSSQYSSTVGGTGDVITLTLAPVITAYAAGQRFSFIAGADNTGAATVNIDTLGAKVISKQGTTTLAANDIRNTAIIIIEYDGTQFQLVSPPGA